MRILLFVTLLLSFFECCSSDGAKEKQSSTSCSVNILAPTANQSVGTEVNISANLKNLNDNKMYYYHIYQINASGQDAYLQMSAPMTGSDIAGKVYLGRPKTDFANYKIYISINSELIPKQTNAYILTSSDLNTLKSSLACQSALQVNKSSP